MAPEADRTHLSPEVIARVREGLVMARNPKVRDHIHRDMAALAAIAQGQADPPINGHIRHWLLRWFIRLFFRVRLQHSQHIPHQANVLVANHLNHLDPFLILAFVPPRPYYYILGDARTLYNKPWKRWLIGWAGGVIPLERWWKEEQAVVAILARGDGILIFPEGRLGDREGDLHLPLKRGTVLYALRSGVPITPVAIVGTKDLYWRKLLILHFGPPLWVPHHPHPSRETIATCLAQLEHSLRQVLPANYQEPQGPQLLKHWLNHLFW
ncbi:MAG: lysophospholipid acyltransferase family protein [Nodosilinea sp.]